MYGSISKKGMHKKFSAQPDMKQNFFLIGFSTAVHFFLHASYHLFNLSQMLGPKEKMGICFVERVSFGSVTILE